MKERGNDWKVEGGERGKGRNGSGPDQVQEEIDSDALNPDIYANTFLICGFYILLIVPSKNNAVHLPRNITILLDSD